jgi:hypothetical protein
MKDIIKSFNTIPSLSVDEMGTKWTFGKGGHGFTDSTWSISVFVGEGIDVDIYPFPPELCKIIDFVYESGREDKLREIKNVLDI